MSDKIDYSATNLYGEIAEKRNGATLDSLNKELEGILRERTDSINGRKYQRIFQEYVNDRLAGNSLENQRNYIKNHCFKESVPDSIVDNLNDSIIGKIFNECILLKERGDLGENRDRFVINSIFKEVNGKVKILIGNQERIL